MQAVSDLKSSKPPGPPASSSTLHNFDAGKTNGLCTEVHLGSLFREQSLRKAVDSSLLP